MTQNFPDALARDPRARGIMADATTPVIVRQASEITLKPLRARRRLGHGFRGALERKRERREDFRVG